MASVGPPLDDFFRKVPFRTKARPPTDMNASDAELYNKIQRFRFQEAVRAYGRGRGPSLLHLIFDNRTLCHLVRSKPRTTDALLRVHGIGEKRAACFGDGLLMIIRAHGP